MNSIKLISKRTNEAYKCDVYLGNFPQMVTVEALGDTAHSYSNFRDLIND